ncbi:MAG TPA: hypothetical protein VFL34_16405 [Candidatus Sulfotelmatobacter sp.]|nr:hypothetical protein [Candidatus Sulfotelmatobacter sp.]
MGLLLWKRRTARQFPAFFAYAILSGIGQLALYAADVLPFVSGSAYWYVDWADQILEALLKFLLIGEIFARIFGAYPSLARLGKLLIRGASAALILAAVLAAASAPQSDRVAIIYRANLLEQTTYIVECGVLVAIFLFAAYFHLEWPRKIFGIALGLSVSSCVHLATWAMIANGGLTHTARVDLVFVNMAAFHLCVLLWFYYLLVPGKVTAKAAVPLPENSLDLWNRELERLVHL